MELSYESEHIDYLKIFIATFLCFLHLNATITTVIAMITATTIAADNTGTMMSVFPVADDSSPVESVATANE